MEAVEDRKRYAQVHGQTGKKKARRLRQQTSEQRLTDEYRRNIEACARAKDAQEALRWLQEFDVNSIRVPAYLYGVVLHVCSNASDVHAVAGRACEIFKKLESLSSSKSTTYIDENIITAMIKIYIHTEKLDCCQELLAKIKTYHIRPRLRTFLPIVSAYGGKGMVEEAFKIRDMIVSYGLEFGECVYTALLEACLKAQDATKFYEVLHEVKENLLQIHPTLWCVLKDWFASEAAKVNGRSWICGPVEVDADGQCVDTKTSLKAVHISEATKSQLLDKIESLIGTKEPKILQWMKYKAWLLENGPFDVVIDGANIAHFNQNFEGGGFHHEQIVRVVEHYQKKNKRVLVVLHKWHIDSRNLPEQMSPIFKQWTESGTMFNCSPGNNDDWYWLFAAVNSGPSCLLITNDEMRDHHFQMIHNKAFKLWKERHQTRYSIHKNHFQYFEPPKFSSQIQCIDHNWYFPLIEETLVWMCCRLT